MPADQVGEKGTTVTETTTLGARLAEARKQRGWTLREAERRTGVANAHLSQIETGAILRPSLDTMVPLAAVYGLPLDELAAQAGHLEALGGTGDQERGEEKADGG